MSADRNVQFKLLLSPSERDQLQQLSEETGLDASSVIRHLVRREHEASSRLSLLERDGALGAAMTQARELSNRSGPAKKAKKSKPRR